MNTTYHFSSAQEISTDILDSIRAKFKSKPITIVVEESDVEIENESEDEIELTNEMKSLLDNRLNEDVSTYITSEESIARLKSKYGL